MKPVLFSILICLNIYSCDVEKEIHIEVDQYPPGLVVNGILDMDSLILVRISTTHQLYDNGPPAALHNVSVVIRENGIILGTLEPYGNNPGYTLHLL